MQNGNLILKTDPVNSTPGLAGGSALLLIQPVMVKVCPWWTIDSTNRQQSVAVPAFFQQYVLTPNSSNTAHRSVVLSFKIRSSTVPSSVRFGQEGLCGQVSNTVWCAIFDLHFQNKDCWQTVHIVWRIMTFRLLLLLSNGCGLVRFTPYPTWLGLGKKKILRYYARVNLHEHALISFIVYLWISSSHWGHTLMRGLCCCVWFLALEQGSLWWWWWSWR